MQYYVSLPRDWVPGKEWPTIVIIDSANRRFKENADLFVRARGRQPFLLVAPLVVTNGGPNYRRAPGYHYSAADWAEIERVGRCRFDLEGIPAMVRDVKKLYGGSEKYFLTAWEAGGHTAWALTFRQPEVLRAVALSGPNYGGRCLEDGRFSTSAARSELPVRVFVGGATLQWTPSHPLFPQWEKVKQVAADHGYRNLSLTVLERKPHGPLAEDVLAYFAEILKK
jgi:dienelactone hydrolase